MGTPSYRPAQVDLAAVAKTLKSGHLRGAAVDVYPSEPKGNGPGFQTVLTGCPNVIMTPHIGVPSAVSAYRVSGAFDQQGLVGAAFFCGLGGSTEEAQRAIGVEVANAIIKYGVRRV